MERLILIDGNSLINRAYYAMQNPMITKDGVYTQGIFGFINMLSKIKKDYSPSHLAVTFDLKGPTFRHEEYKEYKAGRKKMPPELAMQIPLLKEILDAMNIKRIEKEGFEADDLIGTVSKNAEERGFETLIVTGDKDELQLASDKTKIIFTKKGVSQFDIYDREKMFEVYGFSPTQFIDYKGLMGDQSDNIPGVPGVGEKTASKLILEFGTIENVLENRDNISKVGLRTKIEDNKLMAMMSKRLATINRNAPIEIDFEEFKLIEPNTSELMSIYSKLEFNKFLKQLSESDSLNSDKDLILNDKGKRSGAESNLNENADSDNTILKAIDFEVKIIEVGEDIKKILNLQNDFGLKVIGDNSRNAKPQIETIVLAFENTKTLYYIKVNERNLDEIILLLNEATGKIIGHQIKDDIYMLMANGLKKLNLLFDVSICQYLLDSNRSNYDISTLVAGYFQEKMQDEKEFAKENCQVSLFSDGSSEKSAYYAKWFGYVFPLKDKLQIEIEKEGMSELLYDIEMPLIETLAFMEKEGFAIEKNTLMEIGKGISERIDYLKNRIYEMAGEEFNINSTQQLGVILFDKLGLPPSKKTKTGYSTGAEVLEKLKSEHEIIPEILEYRTLAKLNSTYVEGLISLIHKDGKIHANFMQTVAATGRLSCVEPNLQNIPIRQELGRTIRKAFVTTNDEYVLLGADYSQIELRVLAHMSEDANLIEAFNNDKDIHKLTASRVLEIPIDEITSQERSKAKAVNFGVIYGMSAFGLSTEINVTRKEADNYINEYFQKHKSVKEFMDRMIENGKEDGFVSTILNRKRYIKEINSSNYMVRQLGERLAMNSPIQGSAADIIKIAMNKVYKALKDGEYKSKLILQIHDELIIETHRDELEDIKKLLKENMEDAMNLSVKLAVELNEGENWYQLK